MKPTEQEITQDLKDLGMVRLSDIHAAQQRPWINCPCGKRVDVDDVEGALRCHECGAVLCVRCRHGDSLTLHGPDEGMCEPWARGDWLTWQALRHWGIHAYDSRGQRIARVRAVRVSADGIRVRIIIPIRKAHAPTIRSAAIGGTHVAEAEGFIEGGTLRREDP